MKRVKRKIVAAVVFAAVMLVLVGSWLAGGLLCAPTHRQSDPLPADLAAETVHIESGSGARLTGWFIPAAESNAPVIIVMHGVRGCRGDMSERAKLFHREGYATLLFDFQSHGQSTGKQITFGYLESKDAQAAVQFVRNRQPNAKVGALGVSLGGAAALLADPPLKVDAMVLESVYPDIVQATEDRIVMRLGRVGKIFTPLLTCQLRLRLGIGIEQLRPIDAATKVTAPKFFIAGTRDQQTPLPEAMALFAAAAQPKEFWAVEGARHENLHTFAKKEYEERVLAFFAKTLRTKNEYP